MIAVLRRVSGFLPIALVLAAGSPPLHAQSRAAQISGTVVDPVGHVLPGVTVTLEMVEGGPSAIGLPARGTVASTVTSGTGQFTFETVPAGTYAVIAELDGYTRGLHSPVRVLEGQSIDLRLSLAPLAEVVDVVASTGAGRPIEADEIQAELLRVFQLPTDRFQESLPLLPGVIRDPKGRLSFNGTRPSRVRCW